MQITEHEIKGLLIFQPTVFQDKRGYFIETFKKNLFDIDLDFVQDNESLSQKGVLRGLHFQNPPYEQGKLIRVIKGKVLDVAVDIRKNSKTYGRHLALEISEENKTILYIPPGFAHGFATLEDNTIFSYKCTNYYHKDAEGSILWNDKDLNINWKTENPILSEKDSKAGTFADFKSLF
jgi:dTDP-4-dehydrorhamnose 3,5-epimerase